MKYNHNHLRSIAHNIADSLASGHGFLDGVGGYSSNIYDEALKSSKSFIMVDFVNGTSGGEDISDSLAKAINLYSKALPSLCERQGSSVSFFKSLVVCYFSTGHVIITIEDIKGRKSIDEYAGGPLKKVKPTKH
jgi:hypothetical protein